MVIEKKMNIVSNKRHLKFKVPIDKGSNEKLLLTRKYFLVIFNLRYLKLKMDIYSYELIKPLDKKNVKGIDLTLHLMLRNQKRSQMIIIAIRCVKF